MKRELKKRLKEVTDLVAMNNLTCEVYGRKDSKYIKIFSPADWCPFAEIRISGHAQPPGGGYSVNNQERHGEADVSLDPQSKQTIADIAALILKENASPDNYYLR